jgi:glutathione S-transferase
MAAHYTLVLGSKNLSSWSLRPYLALRAVGVAFEEIVVQLDQPDTKAIILAHSPAGKVPVLKSANLVVWDSLAICETLAERHTEAGLWPTEPARRAKARAFAAEMHSGFPELRQSLPMNFARILPTPVLSDAVQAQIGRIIAAWSEALAENEGGFLFGTFSVADCMYAPVVSRFRTYEIALPPVVQAYCARMMGLPAMQDWMAAAKAEVAAGWR